MNPFLNPFSMIELCYASQGVLSGGTEVSSTNESTEIEVAVAAAAVSGTPASAWISPEKHAQTFHIDLSELYSNYIITG